MFSVHVHTQYRCKHSDTNIRFTYISCAHTHCVCTVQHFHRQNVFRLIFIYISLYSLALSSCIFFLHFHFYSCSIHRARSLSRILSLCIYISLHIDVMLCISERRKFVISHTHVRDIADKSITYSQMQW